MARIARRDNQSESGFYHCFSRGNRKQPIFSNEIDYKHFLSLVSDRSDKFGIEIHAFCLMPNHFHLLIKADSVDAMAGFYHGLLSTYTLRFNKIYDLVGHLFQGRYQAKPVHTDLYILEVSRYIHNNPRELFPDAPVEDYRWSSLAGYLNPKLRNQFLKTNFILSYFSSSAAYLSFINKGANAKLT